MESVDRQVRYFLKVAELSSLSRAAEALDITQSGLSRQVAALEAHLGKPLFLRTGRGVELTEAGLRLQEQTKFAYMSIDAALESIKLRHGVTTGTIKLAAVHTLSYYFVGDVVARFASQHAGVTLSMMGRSSPEVVELVEGGKADAGFVYDTAVASDALTSTPLFDDHMCLIVQSGSAVTSGIDLSTSCPPLVGFPTAYALRRMIHSSGLSPRFIAEAETVDAMLKLVSSGMGACILPERMPDRLLSEYQLRKVEIAKPILWRRVVAIVRKDKMHLPLLCNIIENALAVAKYWEPKATHLRT